MKHPIDGLEAFIQIAELGSFNKAAEKLHVTQTALTRRIQRLEAYLGLKLLDRTTRVVVLSTVGRAFLPEAKRLVDELGRSIERLRSQSRDASGPGRRQFDDRLRGFDLDQHVVDLDLVTFAHHPPDDVGLDQSFTGIG